MEPIWVRRISGVAGVFMPKRYMNIYLMSRKKRDGFLRGRNLSYAHCRGGLIEANPQILGSSVGEKAERKGAIRRRSSPRQCTSCPPRRKVYPCQNRSERLVFNANTIHLAWLESLCSWRCRGGAGRAGRGGWIRL